MFKKVCQYCGKEFMALYDKNKFCCRECYINSERDDITGKKFGRLTVIKMVERNKFNQIQYLCKCECGNEKIILGSVLRSGHTQSCGCLHKEIIGKASKKHGKTNTRIYQTWCNIKARCYNSANTYYYNYGGRGIIMCDEWKNNFENFYEWGINNGYSDNLTIDRIDVNGNYEPNNCRWTTREIQNKNTRRTRKITINNETHCLSEWCNIYKINKGTVLSRILRNGWDEVRAVTTPVKKI